MWVIHVDAVEGSTWSVAVCVSVLRGSLACMPSFATCWTCKQESSSSCVKGPTMETSGSPDWAPGASGQEEPSSQFLEVWSLKASLNKYWGYANDIILIIFVLMTVIWTKKSSSCYFICSEMVLFVLSALPAVVDLGPEDSENEVWSFTKNNPQTSKKNPLTNCLRNTAGSYWIKSHKMSWQFKETMLRTQEGWEKSWIQHEVHGCKTKIGPSNNHFVMHICSSRWH